MAEDFTEEQFDDELPEDVEMESIGSKPVNTKRAAAPTPTPTRRERNVAESAAATNVDAPRERYRAFMMPTRIGVIDNYSGRPLAEDTEINNLILGLVTKLLNDVDEIKKSL